MASYRENMP